MHVFYFTILLFSGFYSNSLSFCHTPHLSQSDEIDIPLELVSKTQEKVEQLQLCINQLEEGISLVSILRYQFGLIHNASIKRRICFIKLVMEKLTTDFKPERDDIRQVQLCLEQISINLLH